MTVPQIETQSEDFRTYVPEWINGNQEMLLLQLCEEYDRESGRWEPFYSIVGSVAKRPGDYR